MMITSYTNYDDRIVHRLWWSSSWRWLHRIRLMMIIIIMIITSYTNDDDCHHDDRIVHRWWLLSSWWSHRTQIMMIVIVMMIASYADDDDDDRIVHNWWWLLSWWLHRTQIMMIVIVMMIASYTPRLYTMRQILFRTDGRTNKAILGVGYIDFDAQCWCWYNCCHKNHSKWHYGVAL